jgi:hypothetical protein
MPPLPQALIDADVPAFPPERILGNAITRWFASRPPDSRLFMPWHQLTSTMKARASRLVHAPHTAALVLRVAATGGSHGWFVQ